MNTYIVHTFKEECGRIRVGSGSVSVFALVGTVLSKCGDGKKQRKCMGGGFELTMCAPFAESTSETKNRSRDHCDYKGFVYGCEHMQLTICFLSTG